MPDSVGASFCHVASSRNRRLLALRDDDEAVEGGIGGGGGAGAAASRGWVGKSRSRRAQKGTRGTGEREVVDMAVSAREQHQAGFG
jgi:hypothetical protein